MATSNSTCATRQPLPEHERRHTLPGAQAFIRLLANIFDQVSREIDDDNAMPDDAPILDFDHQRIAQLIDESITAAMAGDAATRQQYLWAIADLLAQLAADTDPSKEWVASLAVDRAVANAARRAGQPPLAS